MTSTDPRVTVPVPLSGPLFVTDDSALLDELQQLAAAAGITAEVAREPAAALRGWSGAPLVLVGPDLAVELARLAPTRRPGVHVVTWSALWGGSETTSAAEVTPDGIFRVALALGAENVAELPRSSAWLTELLTDLGDARAQPGTTVGVLGGSGGAGSTTFACALAQLAAREGPALVVDTDPLGPGLDRVLGLEGVPGVRWEALCQTTGRLSARSLREAVPRRGQLGVLSWHAGSRETLQPFAVREALSAARRGHDTVVVDLPRSGEPLVEELVSRCDLVVVVVNATVLGAASAARLVARMPDRVGLRLVLRGGGVDPRDLARLTGVPVVTSMGDQRGLAEAIDLGMGPVRSPRGSLGRAAAEVLSLASVMVPAA